MNHPRHRGLFLLVGLLTACAANTLRAEIATLWATGETAKVLRGNLDHPDRSGNGVWQGGQVLLHAARNEVVGFQLIVRADYTGVKQLSLELPELRSPSGGVLRAGEPTDDPTATVGREIELFTQHYLTITKPTSVRNWFFKPASDPTEGFVGEVPDALVPVHAKTGLGGLPIDIQPNTNQGFWVDLYVPRDAPPGRYTGTITLSGNDLETRTLPVLLRVSDVTLPDKPGLDMLLYLDPAPILARHGVKPGPAGDELLARYHRLAHRHRVEFTTNGYGPDCSEAMLDLISGKTFSGKAGYEGPGEGVGYRILPANMYHPRKEWYPPNGHATADAFVTWLNQVRPDATTFIYMPDEPTSGKQFKKIADLCDYHRSNPGPGGRLPRLVTLYRSVPAPPLEGLIDIWCTVPEAVDPDEMLRQKSASRQWFWYNGQRPASGTQLIDAPASDMRVMPWICLRYDLPLWFFWKVDHWLNPDDRSKPRDIWSNPTSLNGYGKDYPVNGDGSILYAGRDAFFPAQDRQIDGPVASLRLKNLRRGIQDALLVQLARTSGLAGEADAITRRLVPRALGETSYEDPVSWPAAGKPWADARKKLLRLLEQQLRPNAAQQVTHAVQCPRVKALKPDGTLDEKTWTQGPWTGPFVTVPDGKPAEKPFATRTAARTDGKNLYLAVDCTGGGRMDTVIFNLDPTGRRRRYYRFCVSRNGKLEIGEVVGLGFAARLLHHSLAVATTAETETGWSAELAIPLGELGLDAWYVYAPWAIRVTRQVDGRLFENVPTGAALPIPCRFAEFQIDPTRLDRFLWTLQDPRKTLNRTTDTDGKPLTEFTWVLKNRAGRNQKVVLEARLAGEAYANVPPWQQTLHFHWGEERRLPITLPDAADKSAVLALAVRDAKDNTLLARRVYDITKP
jgi:hypothetical protein